MNNALSNEKQILAIGLFILAIIIIFGYIFVQKIVTEDQLEQAAKIARSQDLQTGYCFDAIQDWWGTNICIKREVAQDGMAVEYMAVSAGKDKSFDTNDDMTVVKIDLNKSKILGKWAGKRAKEVTKGLQEGIFTKSKFDDMDGKKEIGEPDKPENKKFNWKFWKKDN